MNCKRDFTGAPWSELQSHLNLDRSPGNPGSFEDLHRKVKDLYPLHFEGARLILRKVLNKHLNVTHTIVLSSVTPSGYKFGAEYIGGDVIHGEGRFPVMRGEVMTNGHLNASYAHALGCRWRYRLSARLGEKDLTEFRHCLEYRSNDCTAAVTLESPRLLGTGGAVVLHYLQSVTSRIALGGEIACLRHPLSKGGGREALMSLAFRHSTGTSTLSGTAGDAGLHICYHRQASEQLDLGVEFETNAKTHRSVASIVYQVEVPHANMRFRGIFNSECTVGGVFEKNLHPIGDSWLVISGLLNHRKQQFRVGVGLNIG